MSESISLPLVEAHIERGHEKIFVHVPEHEIDVLKAVHGPSNVFAGNAVDDEIELSSSADDEYQRLQGKYRRINAPDPVHAALAHRGGPAALKEHGFDLTRSAREPAPQAGVRTHKKAKPAAAADKGKAKV